MSLQGQGDIVGGAWHKGQATEQLVPAPVATSLDGWLVQSPSCVPLLATPWIASGTTDWNNS